MGADAGAALTRREVVALLSGGGGATADPGEFAVAEG
jgi:hypothetical protein